MRILLHLKFDVVNCLINTLRPINGRHFLDHIFIVFIDYKLLHMDSNFLRVKRVC